MKKHRTRSRRSYDTSLLYVVIALLAIGLYGFLLSRLYDYLQTHQNHQNIVRLHREVFRDRIGPFVGVVYFVLGFLVCVAVYCASRGRREDGLYPLCTDIIIPVTVGLLLSYAFAYLVFQSLLHARQKHTAVWRVLFVCLAVLLLPLFGLAVGVGLMVSSQPQAIRL